MNKSSLYFLGLIILSIAFAHDTGRNAKDGFALLGAGLITYSIVTGLLSYLTPRK